jgi:hypothetical protein
MQSAVRASTLPALERRLQAFEERFGARSELLEADVGTESEDIREWQALYRLYQRVTALRESPQLHVI